MPQRSGTTFNIYDITGSSVGSNGSLVAKLGTLNGEVYTQNSQIWLITGISSMPAAPNSTTDCAQSISINNVSEDIIIATRDTRFQSFVSDISPGDVYIYATGNGVTSGIKVKADNTISLYAPDGITLNAPTSTATNGGSSDYVAMATKVGNELTNIWTTLDAIQVLFYAGGTPGLPIVSTGSYFPPSPPAGPPYVPFSVAGSVLKADS